MCVCLRESESEREKGSIMFKRTIISIAQRFFFHHVSPKHYPVSPHPTPPHPPLSLLTLTPVSYILMHLSPILPSYRAGYNSVTSLVETMQVSQHKWDLLISEFLYPIFVVVCLFGGRGGGAGGATVWAVTFSWQSIYNILLPRFF